MSTINGISWPAAVLVATPVIGDFASLYLQRRLYLATHKACWDTLNNKPMNIDKAQSAVHQLIAAPEQNERAFAKLDTIRYLIYTVASIALFALGICSIGAPLACGLVTYVHYAHFNSNSNLQEISQPAPDLAKPCTLAPNGPAFLN